MTGNVKKKGMFRDSRLDQIESGSMGLRGEKDRGFTSVLKEMNQTFGAESHQVRVAGRSGGKRPLWKGYTSDIESILGMNPMTSEEIGSVKQKRKKLEVDRHPEQEFSVHQGSLLGGGSKKSSSGSMRTSLRNRRLR